MTEQIIENIIAQPNSDFLFLVPFSLGVAIISLFVIVYDSMAKKDDFEKMMNERLKTK